MGDEFFITISPFFITAMSLYILFELIRINMFLKMWEIRSLMLIPILICMLYLWIGSFEPSVELARLYLRLVLSFSLGLGMRVSSSFSKALVVKEGKTR